MLSHFNRVSTTRMLFSAGIWVVHILAVHKPSTGNIHGVNSYSTCNAGYPLGTKVLLIYENHFEC
jgi:hypothetical protein